MYPPFSTLEGKTLVRVEIIPDDIIEFEDSDGSVYRLCHSQDCCESVVIESIVGDLPDLIGAPILLAEDAASGDDPADIAAIKAEVKAANPYSYGYCDSQTWTFYKLRTIKGSVDIRWHGTSNGYYSEGVDFVKVSGE